ncbi:MAG: hypothetical protein RR500_05035 [Bacilli bacterium]
MKIKIFKFIILICLVSYTALFIMVNMGYYEYSSYQKKTLTEEQIKKFESDVKIGKKIDVSSYFAKNENFQELPKSTGSKVSEAVTSVTRKGITTFFKLLNKFIQD